LYGYWVNEGVGNGGSMIGGGEPSMVVDVVSEGSIGFPHMVFGKDWPQTRVLIENVSDYGSWNQSTHQ